MFARKDLGLKWLEIAGVTPDLIRGRNDIPRAACHTAVGRDAFAVLPPAKPALRAASRSEVQDIAPRYEGGTVKTVPYRIRQLNHLLTNAAQL